MLSYEKQLDLKRDVIIKAYKTFSGTSVMYVYFFLWAWPYCSYLLDLPESSVPIVDTTLASPLQYAYRTKITPHFDLPPAARARHKKNGQNSMPQTVAASSTSEKPDWLNIGFNKVGTRNVLDIEVSMLLRYSCPVLTMVAGLSYCYACPEWGIPRNS